MESVEFAVDERHQSKQRISGQDAANLKTSSQLQLKTENLESATQIMARKSTENEWSELVEGALLCGQLYAAITITFLVL